MSGGFRRVGRLGRAGALAAPGAGRIATAVCAVVLALIAVAVAAMAAVAQDQSAAKDDLSRQVLAGPRNLTCQRIVILLDQSGSMSDYAAVRSDAIATLAEWSPANLRGDDELAVISWADQAAFDASPTAVGALTPSTFDAVGSDVGGGTDVLPAVELVAASGPTGCRTSLVFISDGDISGADQTRVDAALLAAGVDRVSLVLPNATAAPQYWVQVFPYSDTFHADASDPDQTARALGQAIAAATGQQLEVER